MKAKTRVFKLTSSCLARAASLLCRDLGRRWTTIPVRRHYRVLEPDRRIRGRSKSNFSPRLAHWQRHLQWSRHRLCNRANRGMRSKTLNTWKVGVFRRGMGKILRSFRLINFALSDEPEKLFHISILIFVGFLRKSVSLAYIYLLLDFKPKNWSTKSKYQDSSVSGVCWHKPINRNFVGIVTVSRKATIPL